MKNHQAQIWDSPAGNPKGSAMERPRPSMTKASRLRRGRRRANGPLRPRVAHSIHLGNSSPICIDMYNIYIYISIYTYLEIHCIIYLDLSSLMSHILFCSRSTEFKIVVFDNSVPFGNPPPNWLEDLFRSVLLCTVGFAWWWWLDARIL